MNATSHKNFYETLGVSRETPPEGIRKAYLKLAHKYHPDKTGGDKAAEERLKEINAAYDTLKNTEKRRQYDAELDMQARGFHPGAGEGPGGTFYGSGFDFGGAGHESAFEDLFGAFFNRGAAQPGQRPAVDAGPDLEVSMVITLEEACTGATKTARIRRPEPCPICKGSGGEAGAVPEPCTQCGGTGQFTQQRGPFSVRTSCPRCHGEGRIITHPCRACGGDGLAEAERTISVTIPAGIDSGARLRLAGQGGGGRRGAPDGDLYVKVQVRPHAIFQRKGSDILCEVPVTVTQAALGDKVRVPTMAGVAELNIPEGTQNGAQFRMRGQGLPRVRGAGHGDQIVKILVEVPVRLNRRQRELLRELAEHSGEESQPKRRSFLDWLRAARGA